MEPNLHSRRRSSTGAGAEIKTFADPGAFWAQKWTKGLLANLFHPCLPTQSLAILPVPSIHMRWQVVNTGCGDDDFFLVGAEALHGQRTLGWHAATLPSSTELMYIFFAVDSMCLLPASGLLSPAFAPARRAHPATGRPVLSPLSPGAAHHRGGRLNDASKEKSILRRTIYGTDTIGFSSSRSIHFCNKKIRQFSTWPPHRPPMKSTPNSVGKPLDGASSAIRRPPRSLSARRRRRNFWP